MAYQKVAKEFFKFENEGDTFEGIFLRTQAGKYGDNAVCKRLSDGATVTVALNTAIRDLPDLVNPGGQFKVVYKGMEKSAKGNEFKAFDMFVDDTVVGEKPAAEQEQATDDDEVPF